MKTTPGRLDQLKSFLQKSQVWLWSGMVVAAIIGAIVFEGFYWYGLLFNHPYGGSAPFLAYVVTIMVLAELWGLLAMEAPSYGVIGVITLMIGLIPLGVIKIDWIVWEVSRPFFVNLFS